MTNEEREEIKSWLAERPQSLWPTIEAFPPGCEIRAEGYAIPSAFVDHIGTVISYLEPDEDGAGLGVVDKCPFNAGIRGHIKASRATLVKETVVTREDIRSMLAELR